MAFEVLDGHYFKCYIVSMWKDLAYLNVFVLRKVQEEPSRNIRFILISFL